MPYWSNTQVRLTLPIWSHSWDTAVDVGADRIADWGPEGFLLHRHRPGVKEVLHLPGVIKHTIFWSIFDFQGCWVEQKKTPSLSGSAFYCVAAVDHCKPHSLPFDDDRVIPRSSGNSLAKDAENETANHIPSSVTIANLVSLYDLQLLNMEGQEPPL